MSQRMVADLAIGYDDSGSGTAVLLVHGNWAERSWWQPLIAQLPAGLRPIAYDLRGRGSTAGPAAQRSIAVHAADLWAFADSLEVPTVHLVGHSLGAAVVLEAALGSPQRVRSLTLIAPAWVDGMPDSYYSPERQRLLAGDRRLFAQAIRAMAPGVTDEQAWAALIERGFAQQLTATLDTQTALRDWRPAERLRDLQLPALVIGGKRDPLITAPTVERCAELLRTTAVLLDCGHSPNLELPQRVAQLLSRHIAQVDA
jgi:pimeloyl-ACP methyl ester carboxylesterase